MTKEQTEETKYPLRTSRRKKTHATIISVAARLFQEHGYKNTTIQMIAERANIHITTVFNHFSNKSDILEEIIRTNQEYMRADIENAIGKKLFFPFVRELSIKNSRAQSGNHKVYDPADGPAGIFLWEDPVATVIWLEYELEKGKLLARFFADENGMDIDRDLEPCLVSSMLTYGTIEVFQKWRKDPLQTNLENETLAMVDTVEALVHGKSIIQRKPLL